MIIRFSKYHGAGNDFIMIDNRSSVLRNLENLSGLISRLCHRKFGVGADGLILLDTSHTSDFEMSFFNSDGKKGSMCGNGGRCSVAFAHSLGLIKDKTIFTAIDGLHEAVILSKDKDCTQVSLKMQDVDNIKKTDNYFILDTGSPHYVCFTKNINDLNVFEEGRKIRYSKLFEKDGINVNFAEVKNNRLFMRTYERGVEDETLSCGTGATATALAASVSKLCKDNGVCNITAPGGELTVRFTKISETSFTDIWLEGPAVCVFKGEINI
jgi:diaminopimelate epimerase